MLRVASADPRPNRAKGRSRLAEMIVPQRWWSNADASSQQEIIGRGHQRNRRRDLGTAVQANGRPSVCVARRATAAGRSPGRGVAFFGRWLLYICVKFLGCGLEVCPGDVVIDVVVEGA